MTREGDRRGLVAAVSVAALLAVLLHLRREQVPDVPDVEPPAAGKTGASDLDVPARAGLARSVPDRFPGTLRLQVSVDGKPAHDAYVMAKPDDDEIGWVGEHVGRGGRVTLAPLPPATWTIVVDGPGASYYNNGEWTYLVPTPVGISSGQEVALTVDVRLYDGTLTVLDGASGRAAVDVPVFLDHECGASVERVTDEYGRISATLPEGRYSARRRARGRPRPPAVAVEWTATGPEPSTVRLVAP